MEKITHLILAGSLAVFSAQATAKLLTVSESGGWTGSDNLNDSLSNAAPNNAPTVAPGGTFTTASWFTNSDPQSELDLEFFSQTLDVPDGGSASFLTARMTHNNVVIFSDDSDPAETFPYIHTLSFAANFLITDPDNGDAVQFSDTPSGAVTHIETLNEAPCAINGSTNPIGTTCDDIFLPIINTADPVAFVIGDFLYTFDFRIEPGPNAVLAPFADGLGFYTGEGDSSFFDIFVDIRSQRIPEPGTIALFGLGLAGLAVAARRRK